MKRKDSILQQYYMSKLPKAQEAGAISILPRSTGDLRGPKIDPRFAQNVAAAKERNRQIQMRAVQPKPSFVGPADTRESTRIIKEAQAAERRKAELQQSSDLAQTFGSFTPSGSSNAGAIGAETFVNMNPITAPITSAGRLTQQVIGQNPYGFGQNNTLATIGLLGDVAGVGSYKILPGSSGLRNIPRQTITAADRQFSQVGRSLAQIEREGKAAGLSDWEISKNQLNKIGITGNQRQAYVPGVSDFLERYVLPYGYEGFGGNSKLTQTVKNILGVDKSLSKYSKEGTLNVTRNPHREDAWSLYLGKPQKYNTFRIAETAPINHPSYPQGSLKNMDVYSLNYENELIPDIENSGTSNSHIIEKYIDPLLKKITHNREADVMGGYNQRLSSSGLQYNDIWDLEPSFTIPRINKKITIPIDKFIGKPFMSHGTIPYTWKTHQNKLLNFLNSKLSNTMQLQNELGIDMTPKAARLIEQINKVQGAKEIFKKGGVIDDQRGQWAHPGQITRIKGNQMATHGYGNIPLHVKANTGEERIVYPNTGTQTFDGATSFVETPLSEYYQMKKGGLTPNKAREILHDKEVHGKPLTEKQRKFFGVMSKGHTMKYDKGGEMIRRADGSYSRRGLWDNIRANKGSGKKPTKEMLEQERKIKAKEMQYGGKFYGMFPSTGMQVNIPQGAMFPREQFGGDDISIPNLRNPLFPKFQLAGQTPKPKRKNIILVESPELISKTPSKEPNPFMQEAKEMQAFINKNFPGEEVSIIPTYGTNPRQSFQQAVAKSDPNTRLTMMAHSGDYLFGIPAEEVANTLKKTKYENCYLGTCYGEQFMDYPEFQNLEKFYYRPLHKWLGFNPGKNPYKGEEAIKYGMFSTMPTEKSEKLFRDVENVWATFWGKYKDEDLSDEQMAKKYPSFKKDLADAKAKSERLRTEAKKAGDYITPSLKKGYNWDIGNKPYPMRVPENPYRQNMPYFTRDLLYNSWDESEY